MAQGPLFRAIQRVANRLGQLMPEQRAIKFAAPLTVADVPETATGSTLTGPGGGGEVSGHHLVGLDLGASGVKQRIVLSTAGSSSQVASNYDALVASRYIQISDYLSAASSVTLYALVGRSAGGASIVHVALYNETDNPGVGDLVVAGTSADTPGEITIDVSAIIPLAKKFYSIRMWSTDAGTASESYIELRIS